MRPGKVHYLKRHAKLTQCGAEPVFPEIREQMAGRPLDAENSLDLRQRRQDRLGRARDVGKENEERPRGGFSGRNSSTIKG